MVKDNQTLDKYIWRCGSKKPVHDTKINKKNNSIFENNRISIQMIYFLLFYYFTKKKSLNMILNETEEDFSKKLGITNINKQTIINFFADIRNNIRKKMHLKWSQSMMGEYNEIEDTGYISFEIDESEIIGNQNVIYWMFGMIERQSKEARIFCVLGNKTKEKLLPYIKNNIITEEYEEVNMPENLSLKTRIFSDCFASYQVSDFKEMGYILKLVNHSVWFGYGLFHTKNIESLWGQIKRYTNNFSCYQ